MGKSDDANRRGLEVARKEIELDVRDGLIRAAVGYFAVQLGDSALAKSETEQALQVTPDDSETRFIAVQTYEALGLHEAALRVLSDATADVLANVNRWPDLMVLRNDPGFLRLLAVRHVQ